MRKRIIIASLFAVELITPLIAGTVFTKEADTSAQMMIGVHIRPRISVNIQNDVRTVIVTQADIQCGSIIVPRASAIEVKSNFLSKYLLTFRGLDPKTFKLFVVDGLGKEVNWIGESGNAAMTAVPGVSKIELNYLLFLSDRALPGTYDWPITVSAATRQ